MRPDQDDFEDFEDEEITQGKGIEPTPGGLAHWLAEQYAGDDRFETIEVEEPGPLDEESVRVKLICTPATHFLVSVLAEDAIVRVGLATEDQEVLDRIEEACDQLGGEVSDLLANGMGAEGEIEHDAEHFHDDVDYFCSDIQYQSDDDLASDILRDEIIYYLDGFLATFCDLVFEEE